MDDQEQKQDAGKPPTYRGLIQRFPRALAAVADVSAFGHGKYGSWHGWEAVDPERYLDAMGRHLLAHAGGETHADDSGLPHLAHAAWCALAVLEITLREGDG